MSAAESLAFLIHKISIVKRPRSSFKSPTARLRVPRDLSDKHRCQMWRLSELQHVKYRQCSPAMKSPEQRVALPLEYASELALELHLMRAECCEAANALIKGSALDEGRLDECIILEEALADAHALLQRAIVTIRRRGSARM